MKLKQILLTTVLATTAIANAQEKSSFSLSGEFRPRTEWRDGFNYRYQPNAAGGNTAGRKGTEGYVLTDARVALKSSYTTDSYTVFTSIQSVITSGERRQIIATGNNKIRFQEAWADINLSESLSLKIGRQPLSYDDQRILGGLGWAQQARTHDVGVFKYKKDGYSLDLGYGFNTETNSNSSSDNTYDLSGFFSYRKIAFARANKKYGKLNISALALYNDFQDENGTGTDAISSLLTAGLHLDYKTGALSLSANGFIQDGDRIFGGNHQEINNAFLASLDATYKVSDKVSVLAGGEVISGANSDSQAFFPLFGTNHKFNGLMDRFYVGNHAVGQGLVDLNVGVSTKIAGAAVSLKGHHFTSESSSDDFGQEVDLVIAKGFKGFKVVGGYSQFFEDDKYPNPAGNALGKDTQNWAWLMLIIAPKFL
ncbi:alginate export family protein [Ochrovirga pacifica]|uniref:alginate export family protein n=1 Tax=Ochrovirga pacifica TaxID=1042376 RepID=UPI000255986A|nr:alginate export family protein [Ochrovirga pacifica]